MKRGFTKPYSNGSLGGEQRQDVSLMRTISWHMKAGRTERAVKLAMKHFPNSALAKSNGGKA